MQRVVISGGSGLVGRHLSSMLGRDNFDVVHLSHRKGRKTGYHTYFWDPAKGYCDSEAFHDGDAIIHLAGANIGGRRWTGDRKREIVDSRTKTAKLLYEYSVGAGIIPSVFVTASATGIYGSSITENVFEESDPPADDFLGETCRLWEAGAEPFRAAGVRVVIIRTAPVLAPTGSVLSKMTAAAKAGLIVRVAPGNQYFPWIHINDLCRIYVKSVSDTDMSGPYNASAPDHITHDMFMSEVARQKRLPVFLPHVPVWLMRVVLGEMSVVLTTGSRISSRRLEDAGFGFSYPDIKSALGAC
jgi:uncharacterized protein (TIGR01777 family)